ncbi:MAG: DUF2163 domain-containing protein [Deltaproteobacteria bacterium]|nr:DUF2163 domain-containing protein [Deltaproteobacteria bacterium]
MKSASADYIAKEESSQRKPVELYHIWRDGGENWRYTSGDVSVSFGGNTYAPATLKRGVAKYDSQLEVTTMTVEAQYAETPFIQFIANNPIETFWIQISKLFRDQDPLEAGVIFIGQIKNVSFKGVQAGVECVGFEHFLKMPVPVFRYQLSCNHNLFDEKCKVVKASYKNTTTVSLDATGCILTSADFGAFDEGYFTYGRVEFNNTYRTIISHSGNTVTLAYKFITLETGNSVDVYPGCDGEIETCRDKFSNVNQFLGFPYIPLENPATRF